MQSKRHYRTGDSTNRDRGTFVYLTLIDQIQALTQSSMRYQRLHSRYDTTNFITYLNLKSSSADEHCSGRDGRASHFVIV